MRRPTGWRPFGLGFRPFFLLAGLAAPLLLALWLFAWHGAGSAATAYYGHLYWHSHEMLFGYTAAVVAGFLLTAVRNWTGQPTPAGAALAALAALWLAGRLLPWFEAAPQALIAALDLAFLPALAMVLARPLWSGANRVNRLFLPLLLGMALANALMHAQALGWSTTSAARGSALMLDLVILLLVFVAGRILPFFTEKAVPGATPKRRPWLEASGLTLIGLLATQHLLPSPAWLIAATWLLLGVSQWLRLWGWHDRGVWRLPILWVLFTGYAWLASGMVLSGLSALGLFPASLATHALTAGGIGVFTLGMMARVALGHTGRPLRASLSTTVAFTLANLAAAARVAGPALLPAWYVGWILLAGLLWVAAFVLFVVTYAPVLLRPRVDGRPD
jgi:uncharacterized protein involved in response to NO